MISSVSLNSRTTQTTEIAVRDLFASPILIQRRPDSARLNAELRALILDRMRASPGTVKTNRKGWQSESDMQTWDAPCVREFTALVMASVREMARHVAASDDERLLDGWQFQACWANVNPPGAYNRPHNHEGRHSHFSGFYYVDIGACESPALAGRTIFEDRSFVARPIPRTGNLRSREFALVPQPGTMALFPAAQYHYVEPYQGTGVRVSIAFNVWHPAFDILYYEGTREQGWWWTNFRGLMILPAKLPEKLRACALLPSYVASEFRQARPGVSPMRRLRIALDRASADASGRDRPLGTSPSGDLAEKQIIR